MSLFNVYLNGQSITVNGNIIVTDIVEEPVEQEIYKSKKAAGPGQRVSQITRRGLSVRVTYVIRERDPFKRAETLDRVAGWAQNGGTLSVSYRSWTEVNDFGFHVTRRRQLPRVVLTTPPALNSSLKWTQDLTMVFTAYDCPYWEDDKENSVGIRTELDTASGVYTAESEIHTLGTAEKSPVWGVISSDGTDALQSVSVQIGESLFRFSGLGEYNTYFVIIRYNAQTGLLEIAAENGTSLMAAREAVSTDELYVVPGANIVTVMSSTKVDVTLTYKERYK